ncbi:hypothetical protein RhiirA5_414645 [Rhizophagus irregularis]|uniref:F-box domain-containing protein n=2 Tax=Rhizophagus irregularis TaxID=588596 RepID=A0A2I1EHB6_9GLOM|nr:hypothetical protein RhiirA5_414645 [Rhizophagus irregularis]PKC60950.1 hypothetical protein RhiirA1_467288 [Rhizophagus irregularis]PKY21511.1 hypothetical protein RhiirB3_435132 [Rhizophagus irregularis]
MPQFYVDYLIEIFEHLEKDKNTLYSCLLVNRLWCEISVRILWTDIINYNTLFTCLPNESKKILHDNGISILNSKPPMFNYASFCKFLSIDDINCNIRKLIKKQLPFPYHNLKNKTHVVSQEILKLLMSQNFSLKELYITTSRLSTAFTSYPEAKDCLKDLSELYISNGLTDLISTQKNLKELEITHVSNKELKDLILLEKLPDTIDNLLICGRNHYMSLSFIAKLTNLKELRLAFFNNDCFEGFKKLQYITFSQLQLLKFIEVSPRNDYLIKFLENNGRNLKEFYINDSNSLLHLAIIKFCPNIRNLYTGIKYNELETLKLFFNNCQLLEILVYNLYYPRSELLPEELESFFISWKNRVPQKQLSLIIFSDKNPLFAHDENRKIIEKYTKLGIIKFS